MGGVVVEMRACPLNPMTTPACAPLAPLCVAQDDAWWRWREGKREGVGRGWEGASGVGRGE